MIACDNPDCNREWVSHQKSRFIIKSKYLYHCYQFHLGCAGLITPPKGRGKWYCRDCEEKIAKVKKRKVH
jgi:hypothetical protein